MASNAADEIGLAIGIGMVGLMFGFVISGFINAYSDDTASAYRKHMIRNDVAEWVINEDGETVFTLKGKQ